MGRLFLTAVFIDERSSGYKSKNSNSLLSFLLVSIHQHQGRSQAQIPLRTEPFASSLSPSGISFPPQAVWVLSRGVGKAQISLTWYRRKFKIEGCSAPQRTLGVRVGTSWENQAPLPSVVQQSSLCKLEWGISRTPVSEYRITISKALQERVLLLQQGSNTVVAGQRQLIQQLLTGIHLVHADTDEAQFSISCCL